MDSYIIGVTAGGLWCDYTITRLERNQEGALTGRTTSSGFLDLSQEQQASAELVVAALGEELFRVSSEAPWRL